MARIVQGDAFYIYCIVEEGCEKTGPCKVGVATNLNARMSSLQGGNWRQLKVAWQSCVRDRKHALEVEFRILVRMRPNMFCHPGPRKRLKSEWVDATPDEAYEAGRDLLEILLEEEAA